METLNSALKPSIEQFNLEEECYHLDDSARPHRTKRIKEWNENNNVNQIVWPGNSKPNRLDCSNKQKLIENIKRIWHNELELRDTYSKFIFIDARQN